MLDLFSLIYFGFILVPIIYFIISRILLKIRRITPDWLVIEGPNKAGYWSYFYNSNYFQSSKHWEYGNFEEIVDELINISTKYSKFSKKDISVIEKLYDLSNVIVVDNTELRIRYSGICNRWEAYLNFKDGKICFEESSLPKLISRIKNILDKA